MRRGRLPRVWGADEWWSGRRARALYREHTDGRATVERPEQLAFAHDHLGVVRFVSTITSGRTRPFVVPRCGAASWIFARIGFKWSCREPGITDCVVAANSLTRTCFSQWRGQDSNLRRLSREIYSLVPLTARDPRQGWALIATASNGRERAAVLARSRNRHTWDHRLGDEVRQLSSSKHTLGRGCLWLQLASRSSWASGAVWSFLSVRLSI